MNQQPAYNRIINSKVQLQLENKVATGQVRRGALVPYGTIVGKYDDKPILNLIVYESEFPDVQSKYHAANIISKNIIYQVDLYGLITTLMESIVDHRKY